MTSLEIVNQFTDTTNGSMNPVTKLIVQIIYLFGMIIGIIASIFIALSVGILLVLCVAYNFILFLLYWTYDKLIIERPISFLALIALLGVLIWIY